MNNEIILICFILALNIYLMKLNLCDNTLCMIFLLFSAIMFVDVLTISNNAIELTFAYFQLFFSIYFNVQKIRSVLS